MEPHCCSSLFLISCEAGEVFWEWPSSNHLSINFTNESGNMRLFTCVHAVEWRGSAENVCTGLSGPQPILPLPHPSSIYLTLPFHPAEAPLSKGGWNKSFQEDITKRLSFLHVSSFCRSLSARQIICHNRSFSLYLSFVKIQLQADSPSFIIILVAFFYTCFKSRPEFPLCRHLWLINKTALWSFSSQSDKTYLLPW